MSSWAAAIRGHNTDTVPATFIKGCCYRLCSEDYFYVSSMNTCSEADIMFKSSGFLLKNY